MSVEIQERPLVGITPSDQNGDHDRFSHIVLEGWHHLDEDGERTGDFTPADNSVVDGMVTGKPVKALCGKVWVPNGDPGKYQTCPTCLDVVKRNGWKL